MNNINAKLIKFMLIENFSGLQYEYALDEVGRGPGAGPVISAAVCLPNGFYHPKLKDSKKMTWKAKEEVYKFIIDNCIDYCIGIASVEEIDKLNILGATMLSMERAVNGLKNKPEFLIIDGNYFKTNLNFPYQTIVKGDSKYMGIAAASVLAKWTRDNIMLDLSKIYTHYDFENNMGYLTKKHIEGIKKYGLCDIHRKSFNLC